MPFLKSFALEHEIVTFAWIDNAFVQFPLNFYATKGYTRKRNGCPSSHGMVAGRVQEWGGDGLVPAFCQQPVVFRGRAVPLPARSLS